jgi:hemolysin activation/secretion protein
MTSIFAYPRLKPVQLVALATLSLASNTALAQLRPDAGQVMRGVEPPALGGGSLPGGRSPGVAPVELLPIDAPSSNMTRFAVHSVKLLGNKVFSESELLALTDGLIGESRTLADLQQAAARITRHYRQAGFLVARAYLPAQKLEDGVVTVAVMEGKLSAVKLDNASNLSGAVVQSFLDGIVLGAPAHSDVLDRSVLLLGDVQGAGGVDAKLAAGTEVGDSVLNIRVGEAPAYGGRVELDNHGGLYTGRNRLGASLQGNSLMGRGERISANLTASNGDLLSGRLDGQLPLGGDGWTVNGGLSRTTYQLGDVYKELDVVGRSDSVELGLRYPLLRSQNSNVYASFNAEKRDLRDEVRSAELTTDKSAKVANLGFNGDWRDKVLGGGLTLGGITLTSGKLHIDSADAAEIDAVAAKTAGSYSKWGWNVSRQQAVLRGVTLVASARGQVAGKNLDSSEKFSLGGPGGVRAFASGEASGDEGWLASLELRYAITDWMGASLFHDRGRVKVNAKPYLEGGNVERRHGTGLGLHGRVGDDWDWQLTAAWRGSEEATAEPDKKIRVWASVGWRF